MEKQPLFPQIHGIMHGGDYNPEQWLDRPDILEKDIELMKKAGMNCATLGVFAWSTLEPREGEYHTQWLFDIMDKLYKNGIYTILATPSGAKPVWLSEKYPEVLRMDAYGIKNHRGFRHNHCMSSMIYRQKVRAVTEKLIEGARTHPGLLMWHISNEFNGDCYCENCVKRFRDYLSRKFDNDIDKLNKAWWTTFWSHSYNDFGQIEPPYVNGEFSVMGLNLEWKRFITWNVTDYMKSEIVLLKEQTPDIPVTANFMQMFDGLDYRVLAKELDVISWDSYPAFHNDYESLADTMNRSAFDHALMRSLKKDKPFMLMESAPGLVNWHDFNKMKRPGIHRLFSLQTVACGSDTVQYFQWRKSRGSYEQYHGAVVDHLGTDDTRVFKEVEALGKELKKIAKVSGTVVKTPVAMILDWDTMWAVADMKGLAASTKNYVKTCVDIFGIFCRLGVDADVISSKDALTDYKVVVAPMMYMLQENSAQKIKQFVENGGQFLTTYLAGYVDENTLCYLGGFPGDGLSEVFGVISEEIDTLYPSDKNEVIWNDGSSAEVFDYAEMLRIVGQNVTVLGTYREDYYAGLPAVTKNAYGQGDAYYVAARMESLGMQHIIEKMLKAANVEFTRLLPGVERHQRTAGKERYTFYFNFSKDEAVIETACKTELLSGKELTGALLLAPFEAAVVMSEIN